MDTKIEAVEQEIREVMGQIGVVERALVAVGADVAYLRRKEEQLWQREQQLRKKEELLLRKEEQQREEKLLLLKASTSGEIPCP
jgi:hypothetical protein